MVIVAGWIEAVVEEFRKWERRRRSHVVHRLAEKEVIAD